MALDSSVVATPFTSPGNMFSSCALISHRIGAALATNSGLILHRSQWQCLVNSYSKVLQVLTHLLQHTSEVESPSLIAALRALHEAMLEGERCMGDCIACPSPPFNHSWLLGKGLKLGVSKDVVDIHLHRFLWAVSTVLDIGLNIVGTNIVSQTHTLESDLIELTKELSNIWGCENAKDDLSSACDFLTAIKSKEEGDTSYLADFVLQKISHAQELECVAPDVLPAYLWVNSESLQRNPEILGLGGYGKVHEAVWLGGRFAVKDFFYVENNEVFGREAAIQARLRHPNVIPLVCCSKKPSLHKYSLVMELMRQDLRVLMLEQIEAGKSPPFSLGVAVDLMLQIAQGMEYLHSLHIMHRDLKSSNILVSFSKETCNSGKDVVCAFTHLKIADFGMSKAKHASTKFTTKHVGATPWRAPEVFEINPEDEMESDTNSKYTKKADVYSFGLVCYEILTGNSPFEGTQIRKRVLAGERPRLPSYCPRALSSYIESCWNAEPSKRPPFSQICRVLRYLKASTLLQDYRSQDPLHYSWLSQPLSQIVCARIDNMVGSLMEPRGLFQPQPLNIPLEMYCCRVVLQQRCEFERTSTEITDSETSLAIARSVIESNDVLEKNHSSQIKLQKGWGKVSSKAGGTRFHWFKKLLCIPGNHLTKSELQDALGMLRDFSFNELQIATNDFSKMIGEGGNGKVYRGKLEDGREIAVKVASRSKTLKSGRLFSISDTMGLVQELRIASQLRHRNLVPLFGWCQARGKFYLIYEYMPNGNLASHIFGEPSSPVLNWQQRYKVSYQLASALKYLHHESGYSQIVHRDVKATNVLLDSEWNARLSDCGLALSLRDGETPLLTLAGTIGYIAPESVAHGKVSTSSDVYAFGVTILEIVSGRRACSYDASSETYYLRDWVWEMFQKGDPIKVADVRLRGEFEVMELKRLLLLGLSCTSKKPHLRPCTTEVLEVLSGVSEPPPLRDETVQSSPSLRDETVQSSVPVIGRIMRWSKTGSPLSLGSRHISLDRGRESDPKAPTLQQNASQRVFLYKELKLATKNFRHDNLLGRGGSGIVHKGWINEVGPTGTRVIAVAVKKLILESLQGHREWLAEVSFLSQLHHPHLVRLIGCCSEDEHRILVYEFMPRLSLGVHLSQRAVQPLDWATRMKIALGAAKGLAFLHGAVRPIIFRNLTTSKILLDWDHTAKLSDFGLAKPGPAEDETHVSTRVKGTSGYVAPEYFLTGHLTWRSDVYNFGIVLLELMTGRRALDPSRPYGEQNLVRWAHPYLVNSQNIQKIVDPRLNGMYSIEGANKAARLAFDCSHFDPKTRPSMNDVVQALEPLQDIEERHD